MHIQLSIGQVQFLTRNPLSEIVPLLEVTLLLTKLRFPVKGVMSSYCDNKVAINITHNPVQNDRTKRIEVDRYFIKEKLMSGQIYIHLSRLMSN